MDIIEIEKEKLAIEKERLKLEKNRQKIDRNILFKNFGVFITGAVALIGVIIPSWIAYYNAQAQKEIEQEMTRQKYEIELNRQILSFIKDNQKFLLSTDTTKQKAFMLLASSIFPPDRVLKMLQAIRSIQPSESGEIILKQ